MTHGIENVKVQDKEVPQKFLVDLDKELYVQCIEPDRSLSPWLASAAALGLTVLVDS